MQNPNGISFDPLSVASSLISYLEPRHYKPEDLFYHNELWQSWNHHGIFSKLISSRLFNKINESQQTAHVFLKKANWLIITLGSAFSYLLKENNKPVANCHRAPATGLQKNFYRLKRCWHCSMKRFTGLFDFNPDLQIVFTISPVRHIRDGVIENNRSKARLIEVAHLLVNKFNRTYYFPAYELVIDVLRDYRFYDKDLVHPNYMATNYVLENFMEYYVNPESRLLAEEIRKLQISRKHRPLHPDTDAHRRFLREQLENTIELSEKYPFLDFATELKHFSASMRV